MDDGSTSSQTRSQKEPLGGVGTVVGGLLLGICFLIAVAVILSWTSSLVFGTGLSFWPAIVLGLVVLSVFVVVGSR